jgi:SPP1 gp7 family putative phage head morphogenesis protein
MDKLIREGIRRVFNNKLKPGRVDSRMVRENAEKLWQGILDGFNKDPKSVTFGSPEQRLLINLRYNVHVMAAFKNHHNVLDITRQLFDKDGKVKEFNQFYKDVKPIMGDYNKVWLEAEFDTARAAARSAGREMGFFKKGGKVTYMTKRDGRVSDEHKLLDGITLPVTDIFWDTHTPPLRWRCRCYKRWAGYDVPDVRPTSLPNIQPMFANNPFKTGKVFNEAHPYFNVESQYHKLAENLFGYKPPVDPIKYENNLKIFNKLYENPLYNLEGIDNLMGGYIFRHIKSDTKEFSQLLNVGKKLVSIPGKKNPDFNMNGIPAELKANETPTISAIDNALRKAKSQAGIVILDIKSNIKPAELEKAVYNRVQRTDEIHEVHILYKDKIYKLTRQEIINRTFFGKIK